MLLKTGGRRVVHDAEGVLERPFIGQPSHTAKALWVVRPSIGLGAAGLGDAMLSNSAYAETTLIRVTLYVLLCSITIRATINQLRDERDHDALTQILNRRAFHEAARQRLADRRLYPMAVLASDLDHFKCVNMIVPIKYCSWFLRNVRSQALVARFGD